MSDDFDVDTAESFEIEQSLDLKESHVFDRATLYLGTAIFLLLIVITIAQVMIRQLGLPIRAPWTEPLARVLFIVGTYFGMAVASRNDEHIKLTLLQEYLGEDSMVTKFLDVIVHLAIIAILAIALYGSIGAMTDNWSNRVMGGEVLYGWIFLGISIGILLTIVYEVVNLFTSASAFVVGQKSLSSVYEKYRGD